MVYDVIPLKTHENEYWVNNKENMIWQQFEKCSEHKIYAVHILGALWALPTVVRMYNTNRCSIACSNILENVQGLKQQLVDHKMKCNEVAPKLNCLPPLVFAYCLYSALTLCLPPFSQHQNKYKLFTGCEVHIVKYCA